MPDSFKLLSLPFFFKTGFKELFRWCNVESMNLDEIHELAELVRILRSKNTREYCLDEERNEFTHVELRALALNLVCSGSKIRKELESWGLVLSERAKEKRTRGFTANSHDRWHGAGSCPSHGGSGWQQIAGFAGRPG